ncbi:MAG: hypothetical protein P8X60_01360 [Robiginitalea sp.]|jgi:protein CpxP
MNKTMTFCLLLIGLGAAAQQGPHHKRLKHRAYQELTVEQQASLQSKRMTLALSLDENQQEKIESLLTRHYSKRSAMRSTREGERDSLKHHTPEKRYAQQSRRLDHQIAFQRELIAILTTDQSRQWQKWRSQRRLRHNTRSGRR